MVILYIDESFQCHFTLDTNIEEDSTTDDFSLESSDNNIVSISNNNELHGEAQGSCLITVSHISGITDCFDCFVLTPNSMSPIAEMKSLYYEALSYYGAQDAATLSTLQLIRSIKYSTSSWETAAGKIDQIFINSVNQNPSSTYSFFKNNNDLYFTDSIDNTFIDFYHLCAALNGLIYSNNNIVFPIYSTHLSNLCGWAGDLQTLCVDVIKQTSNSDDFTTVYNIAFSMIGSPSYSMSIMDILADVDAYNIFVLLSNTTSDLVHVWDYYYTYEYNHRFTLFADTMFQNDMLTIVRQYTTNYFMFSQEWPLLSGHTISDTQSDAIAQAFVDFINSHVELENNG